jgi:hypothetical protein
MVAKEGARVEGTASESTQSLHCLLQRCPAHPPLHSTHPPTITIIRIEKVNMTYTENLQILTRLITSGDSIEMNRLTCTGTSRIHQTQSIGRQHNTGACIKDVERGGLMQYRENVCVCVCVCACDYVREYACVGKRDWRSV